MACPTFVKAANVLFIHITAMKVKRGERKQDRLKDGYKDENK